ncbi:MAG: hypothetical protein NUW24_06550 [Anaerolineae bacterium]|jgi:hypothetical protein|nr:hypothetical protein [Anaerolineae bacterium]MDH7472775.1 hypothetical protein [Anaerolineae bacterium]
MKTQTLITILVVLALSLVLSRSLITAQGPEPPVSPRVGGTEGGSIQATLGTAFTYQGQLKQSGSPVNGNCDFQFSLYDAASNGSQIGSTQSKADVSVSNGLFTIPDLDFGSSAFTGDARWLQVAVRCPTGSGMYTNLSPRQAITAAPYALGLRPGASISGAEGSYSTLNVLNGWPGGVWPPEKRAIAGWTNDGTALWGAADSGTGVYGVAAATSGETYGVAGVSASLAGAGVYGLNTATSGYAYGVRGDTASTLGRGVVGWARATSGYTIGVWGRSDSTDGAGVVGHALATSGETHGVRGQSDSPNGRGVVGWATATSGNNYGVLGQSSSTSGIGVYGRATATSGNAAGVVGSSTSTDGVGVFGSSEGRDGIGVYGTAPDTGYAGYFLGDVHVEGTLSKAAGGFKIDHPLDPANKYLNHSFVESPDMKNIYDGVVLLDTRGEAWVQLPEWFEALNRDFRYQLAAIGAPMPNLYIAQEIQDNRFQIAGGVPGMKVSWQVTGIRHDPFAEQNRIPVEEEKSADERGTYLYPAGYGRPEEMGLDYQRHARLFERGFEAPPDISGADER